MWIILPFFSHLDVTIGNLRTVGLGTHCQLHVMLPHKIQSLQHILTERVTIGDVLVRRAHDETSIRTTALNLQRSPRHRWHRVSAHRFHQDVLILDARNLLRHQLAVALICHDDDVVCINKTSKSVEGHLEHRFARSQHVDELLRLLLTAHRPQAGTQSSSQYHTIITFVHIHLIGLVGILSG